MNKPQMMLKWEDEKEARPISRASAAATIWKNRRAAKELRVEVFRRYGETYIASQVLGVACCIFRAEAA